jgi:ubiquinone/menaquinone biosynthesis C-methylase UbiE
MTRDTNHAIALQRKYYTDTASRYEEMHEHEGSGDPLHMDFIVSLLRMLQVRTVLDVGTASGRTIRNLKTAIPELFICGIEPVGALLAEAVTRGNADSGAIIQGNGDALPFADNSFDVVCEFAILHHVADPRTIVGEMLRVAKKAVILSDSNRFGQGPMFLRLVKLALYKTRLWRVFNGLRTSGKGYQISEGDGLAYSYSVYDSFDQIARWADRVLVIPADKTRTVSWLHPLLTSGTVILCGIRES